MIKASDERVKSAMLPKIEKSGGPTSKKGKKAISQNAVKSGVYSRSIVLPTEDKNAYQALLASYIKEFSPSDMTETTMVTSLANLTWRKMRLDHYEQSSLIAELNKGVTLSVLKQENLMYFPRDILWLEIKVEFGRYLNVSFEELENYYKKMVGHIAKLYSEEVNTHYAERFFGQYPDLLKEIIKVAEGDFNRKDIEVKDLLKEKTYIEHNGVQLLEACTNSILEKHKDIAWYKDNQDKINQAKLALREKWVMEKMQQTDFSRAHDELDRSFYRTLTEIRKQQQWRREQNEVVVIQESPKK